jgi:quinol monooxygenase YgiN
MFISLLRIKVSPQDRSDAVRTLKSIIGPTRAKAACQTCEVYAHIDNDDELLLVEKWENIEGLNSHIGSRHFEALLAAMELATENPVVEFHEVNSEYKGIPYIEKIRLR